MGKLRRERTKYHLKKSSANEAVCVEDKEPNTTPLAPPVYSIPDNVFAGVDITLDKLEQKLQDSDAVSVKSAKSCIKEKHIPKKEKRRLRHEAFLRKLETTQQMKKQVKVFKGKPKGGFVSDLNTIVSTVRTIADSKPKEAAKKKKKMRSIPKSKYRQKKMLQDISTFRKLLSDPEYKVSPLRVATDLVEKKVCTENDN